jgi:hypothetical protein
MSKKTNLEYHPSQELPFISHLQKLEDSITDYNGTQKLDC